MADITNLFVAIGWLPIPAAVVAGFSVEYFFCRNYRVCNVWPCETVTTAGGVGLACGLLFGLLSAHIRSVIFELSFGELVGFVLILALLSWSAATFGAFVLAGPLRPNMLNNKDDKSYANVKEVFVLGHTFRRMTEEDRKELNYTIHHRDIFIYWLPRKDGYIVYEPTRKVITDVSGCYSDRSWLALK